MNKQQAIQQFPIGSEIMVEKGKFLYGDSSKIKNDKRLYGKITHHNRVTAGITGDRTLSGLIHCNVRFEDLELADRPLPGPFGPVSIGLRKGSEYLQSLNKEE